MKFRSDINGLRALAVVSVVLFHFGLPKMDGGFVGVDVFFVISGFLMTGIIFKRVEEGVFSLLGFYLDRARRIVPALAVLCLTLLVTGWFFLTASDYMMLGKHVAGSIGFVSNMMFWHETGYFDAASHDKWLLQSWSLSVEWQFYLLYPLVILILRSLLTQAWTRGLMVIFAICSFTLSVYVSARWPGAAFYLLPTRAWEMLLGGLVYLFPIAITKRRALVMEWSGLALIVFSILKFSPTDIWPGWLASIPVVGTALVIMSARNESRLTGNWLAQFLGKTSYSVYLWHWPFVVVLNYFDQKENVSWVAVAIVTSLAMGYLSFVFIETPVRNLRTHQNISYRQRLLRFALATGGIAILGASVFASSGITSRVSSAVNIAERESSDKNPYMNDCIIASGTSSPECIMGVATETSGTRIKREGYQNADKASPEKDQRDISVIVLGDSHAGAVVSAVVDSIPHDKRGGALFLGYLGCVTIPDATIKRAPECGAYMHNIFAKLAKDYIGIPIVVINRTSLYVSGYNEEGSFKAVAPYVPQTKKNTVRAEFRSKYIQAICQLSQHRPVYITKPIPEFGINVPIRLGRELMFSGRAPDISLNLTDYWKREDFALTTIQEASQECSVTVLDPVPYLCPGDKCMGSIHNRPLYSDSNHLSEYGNRLLIPMFKNIFK